MARYWTDPERHRDAGLHFPHPFEGLELVIARGRRVADLREIAQFDDRNGTDPFAICTIAVKPGPYFVRHSLANGRIVEQVLITSPDWDTRLIIRRAPSDAAADSAQARITAVGELTILMQQLGNVSTSEDMLLEGARIALAWFVPRNF
jgi:hypothetical protein